MLFRSADGVGNTWVAHLIDGGFSASFDIYAADINGDGEIDVIGAAQNADQVSWWGREDYLEVTSPNGGESWWVETEHAITWTTIVDDSVSLELYNGPDLSLTIAADIANDGEFTWTIPVDLPPGQDYTIRVFLTEDESAEDTSDGPFTILAEPNPDPVEFTVTPITTEVGADGGDITYSVSIINNTGNLFSGVTYWTMAILPNGNPFGPLYSQAFNLFPMQEIDVPLISQNVPAFAPTGQYFHVSDIGIYPAAYLTEQFQFTKLGVSSSLAHSESDWSVTGFDLPAVSQIALTEDQPLPTEFLVEDAYPNPFNPTTTINISLPVAADLSVVVYNITGQQVAELANGQFRAGSHKLTFDGSGMASGLYFVRTTISGEISQVQKVMLVR